MEANAPSRAAAKLATNKKKKKATRRKKAHRSFKNCHQALHTTELLEEILSHLPIKDLLFAQAVCSTWRNCIKALPRLQRGLFFQLPEGIAATDVLPILLSRTGNEIKSTDKDLADIRSTAINPLLRKVLPQDVLAGRYIMRLNVPASSSQTRAMRRPEASWRRIHLCYPEVVTIDLDNFAYKEWKMYGGAMALTPKLNRELKSIIKPQLHSDIGDMISWMHECETAAELEAHIDGIGWEDVDDDDDDKE